MSPHMDMPKPQMDGSMVSYLTTHKLREVVVGNPTLKHHAKNRYEFVIFNTGREMRSGLGKSSCTRKHSRNLCILFPPPSPARPLTRLPILIFVLQLTVLGVISLQQ